MIVLSLDPSSKCVGHAGYDTAARLWLPDLCGRVLPAKRSADAEARLLSMVPDVRGLMHGEPFPAVVLVEVPDGRQYSRGGARTSTLPVWGHAAGFVHGYAVAQATARVIGVGNGWTQDYRGSVGGDAKAFRRMAASRLAPTIYTPANANRDTGGDLADAICMLQWWWDRQVAATARQAKERPA